jgi:hypothetical protein
MKATMTQPTAVRANRRRCTAHFLSTNGIFWVNAETTLEHCIQTHTNNTGRQPLCHSEDPKEPYKSGRASTAQRRRVETASTVQSLAQTHGRTRSRVSGNPGQAGAKASASAADRRSCAIRLLDCGLFGPGAISSLGTHTLESKDTAECQPCLVTQTNACWNSQ